MLPILHAKKSTERDSHLPARFEGRLFLSVVLAGAPGVAFSFLLLWHTGYTLDHKVEGSAFVLLFWLALSLSARDKVVNALRVLSNVISAVKDDDFSFLATRATPGDVLGDLASEINNLSRALAEERLGVVETTNLLRKVMAEAGTIIFAFSTDNRLRIVNRTGARFLGKEEAEILHRSATELGLEKLLEGPAWEVISRQEGGAEKRWIIRRTTFRQSGEPHRLVVLSEASEALRAEERIAWQRLIRVLSHEVNNSLAPIRTIARTLSRMASNTQLPIRLSEDLNHGLAVIHDRADSLGRFLQSYTRVATLPKPVKRTVVLSSLIAHVAALESRITVQVVPGPSATIFVDPVQLEQALINLVKNAADAVLLVSERDIGPEAVTVTWDVHVNDVEIRICDEGIGLTDTDNLFVPFYTTKQSGSGIGLLLSRQIIEAHKGTLTLKNRSDRSGCEVEVKLPTYRSDSSELNDSTQDQATLSLQRNMGSD
ncbi:MAG TPA: ATP-binding protein [Candidatus Angelobacter sp.]